MAQIIRTLASKQDFTTTLIKAKRFREQVEISPIQHIEKFPLVKDYKSINTNATCVFFENAFTLGDGLGGLYIKSNTTDADDIGVVITIGTQRYKRHFAGVVLLDWFDENFNNALLKASKYYNIQCTKGKVYEANAFTFKVNSGISLDLNESTVVFKGQPEYCFILSVRKDTVLNIFNGTIEVDDQTNLINICKLIKTNNYVDLLTAMTYNVPVDKLPDTNKIITDTEDIHFKANKHFQMLEYIGTEDPLLAGDNFVVPLTYKPQIDDSDCIKLTEPVGDLIIDEIQGRKDGVDNEAALCSQLDLLSRTYAKDYFDNYFRNNKAFTTTSPGGYYTVKKGATPILQGQWAKYTYDGIPNTIDVYTEAIANIDFSIATEILMDEGEFNKPIYIKGVFKKPLNGTFQLTEVECAEAKEMCEGMGPLTADSFNILRIDNFPADLGLVEDSYGGLVGVGLSIKKVDKPEFYLADTVTPGTTQVQSIKEFYIKAFEITGNYTYGLSMVGYDQILADFNAKYSKQMAEEFNKAALGQKNFWTNFMAAVGWDYFTQHYGKQTTDEFKVELNKRGTEIYKQGGLVSKIKLGLLYRGKYSYSNEASLYIARLIPANGLEANKEHKYYSKYTSGYLAPVYGYPNLFFYYNNTPVTLKVDTKKVEDINWKYSNVWWLLCNGFLGTRPSGYKGAPYNSIMGSCCCAGGIACGNTALVFESIYDLYGVEGYIRIRRGEADAWAGNKSKDCTRASSSFNILRAFKGNVVQGNLYTDGVLYNKNNTGKKGVVTYEDLLEHRVNFKPFKNLGPTTITPGNYGVASFYLSVRETCYMNSVISNSVLEKYNGNIYKANYKYSNTSKQQKYTHTFIETSPLNFRFPLNTFPNKSGKIDPYFVGDCFRNIGYWGGGCWDSAENWTAWWDTAPDDGIVYANHASKSQNYYVVGDLLGIQLSIVNGIGKNRLFNNVFGYGNWDFTDNIDPDTKLQIGSERYLQGSYDSKTEEYRVAWRQPGAHIKCCDSIKRANLTYTNNFTEPDEGNTIYRLYKSSYFHKYYNMDLVNKT